MRYELGDYEWSVIRPDAPEQAARHSSRRRSAHSQWHLLGLALRCTMARSTKQLRSPYDLLQSFRSLAADWSLGPDHGCALAAAHDAGLQMIDTSVVRVHQHGACIAGNKEQHMGRSRGGLTSKIHAVVDANGLPIRLGLTPGEAHDNRLCSMLLTGLRPRTMLLADRGYDADWIRTLANQQGAWANIPPKCNRTDPICFSPYFYRARNLVERFFNRIKQCRRFATRYDKLAANCLAFIELAAIRIWLRVYESTSLRACTHK